MTTTTAQGSFCLSLKTLNKPMSGYVQKWRGQALFSKALPRLL
jgi:hypothetical protein